MNKLIYSLIVLVMSSSLHADMHVGNFNEEEICIAGIAANNGRSAKNIHVLARQDDVITVAYTRDDGKIFGYSCKIEDGQVRWRDQGMDEWNSNIKIHYEIFKDGVELGIKVAIFDEIMAEESFGKEDF